MKNKKTLLDASSEMFPKGKLTPTELKTEEMEIYKKVLDYAMAEDDLLNVAITGPYASGKSSVIYTYEKCLEKESNSKKKKDFIHISLAYFDPPSTLKFDQNHQLSNGNLSANEHFLERKILNQLIHQINPKKIPATDFRVKKDTAKSGLIISSCGIALALFLFIFIDLKKEQILNYFSDTYSLPLLLVSFVLLLTAVTYKILKTQYEQGFIRKLKFFQSEVDLASSKEQDTSYFDKYIDEILYILNKSKVKAIVFEDIDRYDDNFILNKLRELNYIYNKKHSQKIKFFYLLKDEIFQSKDRTKFFDYIIPIVPILSASNAFSIVNNLADESGIKKDFKDSSFLYELSLYIDDLRLLKNIFNEYIIYKNKIPIETHDWLTAEKLLAIIIYKNIFPNDFSQSWLGLGRGVVHRIVSSLGEVNKLLIKHKEPIFDEKINKIQIKINSIKFEFLDDIDDLKALFSTIPKLSNYPFLNRNRSEAGTSLPIKELINQLKEKNLTAWNMSGYSDEITLSDVVLDENEKYTERKEILEQKETGEINVLEDEIMELMEEKKTLNRRRNLAELYRLHSSFKSKNGSLPRSNDFLELHFSYYEEMNSDHSPIQEEYRNIKTSPYFSLLKYLLLEGYIDENYSEYMSLFHEGGLHPNNIKYLRGITSRVELSSDLELFNCELLANSMLKESYYEEVYIFNFSLLDYLIASKHAQLDRLIQAVVNLEQYAFVSEYIERQLSINVDKEEINSYVIKASNQYDGLIDFVKRLNNIAPTIWEEINAQKEYVYLSLIASDDCDLQKIGNGYKLRAYINVSANFLAAENSLKTLILGHEEKIVDSLKKLGIKIRALNDQAVPELIEGMCKNQLYAINIENIDFIIHRRHSLLDYKSHRFQVILGLKESASLYQDFKSQAQAFAKTIVESADTRYFDDDEDTVVAILNHADIPQELKTQYIEKINKKISVLESITDHATYSAIFQSNKVIYNAANIIHYFICKIGKNYASEDVGEEKGILIDFINGIEEQVDWGNGKELVAKLEDNLSLFFNFITLASELNDESYDEFMSWFNGQYYKNFNYEEISKTKTSILIKHAAIKLGEKQNLSFLREHYPSNIDELVLKNFDAYIEKLENDSELVDHQEMINLLNQPLEDQQRLKLLALTSEPISLKSLALSEQIESYILSNNFKVEDFSYIISTNYYDKRGVAIQTKVQGIAIEKFDSLRNYLHRISFNLSMALIRSEQLNGAQKTELLVGTLSGVSTSQGYNLFLSFENANPSETLSEIGFSGLFKRKKISAPSQSPYKEILDIMEERGWILGYRNSFNKDLFLASGRDSIK